MKDVTGEQKEVCGYRFMIVKHLAAILIVICNVVTIIDNY